jgi:hypothetical protein
MEVKVKSIRITKQEYELDDEDWLVQLGEKYGFKSSNAVDVQRNYDAKKNRYTVDLVFQGGTMRVGDIHAATVSQEEFQHIVRDKDLDAFLAVLEREGLPTNGANYEVSDWASEMEQRRGDWYIHITRTQ